MWTITVWPVTPHSESSVPMVNGMAPTFKPGFTLYGEALPDASLVQTASYSPVHGSGAIGHSDMLPAGLPDQSVKIVTPETRGFQQVVAGRKGAARLV